MGIVMEASVEQDNNELVESIKPGSNKDQFLSFMISDEEFAVNILKVQEIMGWEKTTRLPNSPSYVKGVLNLRGAVVPIIDLRERFGHTDLVYDENIVVIVANIEYKDKHRTCGLVVDAVSDVHDVDSTDVQEAPDVTSSDLDKRFISGLLPVTLSDKEYKMVIVLDIDKLTVDAIMQS